MDAGRVSPRERGPRPFVARADPGPRAFPKSAFLARRSPGSLATATPPDVASPAMAQLSAVLFDIDDTLCATTEFAKLARHNAITAMIEAGLKAPVEEL